MNPVMNLITDWSQIPLGLHLIKMFHERTGKHVLHVHLKLSDDPWYEQPKVPATLSQESSQDSHLGFWEWAEHNLPIYEYPDKVKSSA